MGEVCIVLLWSLPDDNFDNFIRTNSVFVIELIMLLPLYGLNIDSSKVFLYSDYMLILF
jgi:uncharacterized membrane protein YwzB